MSQPKKPRPDLLSDDQVEEMAQRPISDDEWELIWQIRDEYEAELARLYDVIEDQRSALYEAFE